MLAIPDPHTNPTFANLLLVHCQLVHFENVRAIAPRFVELHDWKIHACSELHEDSDEVNVISRCRTLGLACSI
jgi:hypothetical protein